MENDPYSQWVILSNLNITFFPFSLNAIGGLILTLILLLFSALISASEIAFFSLDPSELTQVREGKSSGFKNINHLIEKPQELLATILVSNNFVNIAIVLTSTWVMNSLIDFSQAPILGFIIQVILITFVILLCGEIIPKIYANQTPLKVAKFMAIPLIFLRKLFKPLILFLMASTKVIDKKHHRKYNISRDDLSNALELTSESLAEEKGILKGIIEFGNIEVSDIMCPRVDVLALDINTPFSKVLQEIVGAGYSRIPVYLKTFDDVKGILYIKDLLPHIHKTDTFHWQSLIRPPYFVPERKKINELLEELQTDKIHMAIVVDEYGGTSGIITMEDIIEEIVGDIADEFDEEDEVPFSKINENNYLFDGKILLNDFYKIMDVENDIFDDIKGDADTLAGLILEIKGDFPELYDKITFEPFTFIIEAVDKRRIVKIKTSVRR
ncbi:MAG: hemolysin [Bacteroidetes bacterium GWE2_40_63]|nr:MAG: hemolysin [Bacteroidetes bacterium GWA2_40_14]OFX61944.1 MAG: hemolysin [Bacteroidetes bacterium GWC2_40_13]OFX74091.1 MAG: hemolysin [Bacteroidetes bacterium GWD2_40_43]OFX93075.1 MAG: hemolysin [Bacteroidetes bacterium GWE2_40_63]OFY21445.1 MAG: hemolysin [Bacteroidetes bacterium GWF2_40_13]OFZ25133.1 MAG: hemolysin [Bacteroidetes bacterium RIFOXYC2_FULL_40_12]